MDWLLIAYTCTLAKFFYGTPIATAEKRVSVKEVVFDSPIEQLEWLGSKHTTVICRTSSSQLYRSIDSGQTWRDMSPEFKSDFRCKLLVKHSVNPDVALFVGKQHDHYLTRDGGLTFKHFQRIDGIVHSVLFHPEDQQSFLISQWTDACFHHAHLPKHKKNVCSHDLYITEDTAEHFHLLSNYVIQFAWARSRERLIYLTKFDVSSGNQPQKKGWSPLATFGYISAKHHKFHKLIPRGNKFLISVNYIYVAKLLDENTQHVQLVVSTDDGRSFKPIELPEELYQNSYTIVDTSDDSVMLHVNHGHASNKEYGIGHVYISDKEGVRFSLSLPRNIRSETGATEIDQVAGLPSVYIANFDKLRRGHNLDAIHAQPQKDLPGTQDILQSESDQRDSMVYEDDSDFDSEVASETSIDNNKKLALYEKKSKASIKTVISFDKGAAWSYLNPPHIDSRGHKIHCASGLKDAFPATSAEPDLEHCSLHLHGITQFHRYAPFYSVENAVGLVIATGNVGYELSFEEDQVNTYLSRDGGLNWVEAHKGAYIYEIGDHGGLIVMAHDTHLTNQVIFSWNEGQTWYDFDLGTNFLSVENILTEPNSSSVEFLLYGTRDSSGVLYHLDFASLQQPACHGEWAPDSVSSDYETWTPTDGRTSRKCLNGEELILTRRKATSECFNGKSFQRPVSTKRCSCTEFDYQCEYGFSRLVGGTQCIPDSPLLDHPQCSSSAIFYADAYRKIPGNQCHQGWKPSKVPIMCPPNSPMSMRAHFILITFIAMLLSALLLTYSQTDQHFKKFFANFQRWKSARPLRSNSWGNANINGMKAAPDGYYAINQQMTHPQGTSLSQSCPKFGRCEEDFKDDVIKFMTSTGDEVPESLIAVDETSDLKAPPLLDFDQEVACQLDNGMADTIPKLHAPPSKFKHNSMF